MSCLIFLDNLARPSLSIRRMLQQHHPEGDVFKRRMLGNNSEKNSVSNLCIEEGNFLQVELFLPKRKSGSWERAVRGKRLQGEVL